MAADEQELTWRLSDPGMDLLERAGLAALYMTLRAAREAQVDLLPLRWEDSELTPDSVTVRWSGPAKPVFVRLMEWAWQVCEGVLYLPGVHGERERSGFHLRLPSHNGIMRTFLQHTNVQPKGEPVTRIVRLDEDREISVTYQEPIIRPSRARGNTDEPASGEAGTEKKLLKAWKDISMLFDRHQAFRPDAVKLSNWVYPGIAGRYGGEEAWQGTPQRAILLMLAPTTCLFQRLQGSGGNWVLVVPDIRDLEEFEAVRKRMNLDAEFTDVASLGDAGLQFLAEYSTRNPRKTLQAGCRVIAMGKVGYYASQSIRKGVLDVAAEMLPVKRYRLLHRELPNRYISVKTEEPTPSIEGGTQSQKPKVKKPAKPKKQPKADSNADDAPKAVGFIKLPAARGRIADNLVNGRPWYADLFVPMGWDSDELERQRKRQPGKSIERILFTAICYQRSKLMKLIQEDDMWDSEAEKYFVHAFWETLRALYRQEAEAVKDRGGARTVTDRMEDLNEDIRRVLMQAKTRVLLRDRLAEYFSRPVKKFRSPTLTAHAPVIWRLVDGDWRKGRDLALLALASYRSEEKRNASEGPSATTAQDTKGD